MRFLREILTESSRRRLVAVFVWSPVKALNKAGLEASVRAYGSSGVVSRWPSPYIVASGVLLMASFFEWLFPPLQCLAVAAVVAGAPPMASAGMSSLMGMLPAKAVLATTGDVVSVRDVRVGDVVAVRAGEIVPVDGVVVDG
uniref:P-type ATPase A domain-containing protein n=1 Tax=Oryza meridionalis TaxID=40149 RepID=A0A0E0E5W4_9ORYZ